MIVAEAAIARAEDALRALVFNPSAPDFWQLRLEPTEPIVFRPTPVDLEAAVRNALQKRTDLLAVAQAARVERRQHPLLQEPVDAGRERLARPTARQAIGGTAFLRGPGFPGEVIGSAEKSYGATLGDDVRRRLPDLDAGDAGELPDWLLERRGHPRAGPAAGSAVAQAAAEPSSCRWPPRCATSRARCSTNAKRVDATRASRTLAERRLEAEEKKFQAGMTTSFLVFQAQRDLDQARNNELQALLDYNKSVVDFEAAQEAPLTGTSGISTVNTAGFTSATTGTTRQQ